MARHTLAEMVELEKILAMGGHRLETRRVCEITVESQRFPIYAASLGSTDPSAPAIAFVGGVHGIEKIGTQVILAFMRSVLARLKWDRVLQHQLEHVRMVFMPLVNPGGMWLHRRGNPRGIDLMRNAPIESAERVAFLVGGQRISPLLPWYRGAANTPMEPENQALAEVMESELLNRRFSLVLDCHSGFGLRDRIWFPYAFSRRPFKHLAEVLALKELLDHSYPSHPYLFEPQCHQYLTHGDLWDYLSEQRAHRADNVFLPLTLELGSWLWVKKNPRQLLSFTGLFNPTVPHRQQRVLRGHMLWLDFLTRAVIAHEHWRPGAEARWNHHRHACATWYA